MSLRIWNGGDAKSNAADRDRHGNTQLGGNHANAKLDEKKALEIYNSTESNNVLASRYQVSRRTIQFIRHKKTWKHIHKDEDTKDE